MKLYRTAYIISPHPTPAPGCSTEKTVERNYSINDRFNSNGDCALNVLQHAIFHCMPREARESCTMYIYATHYIILGFLVLMHYHIIHHNPFHSTWQIGKTKQCKSWILVVGCFKDSKNNSRATNREENTCLILTHQAGLLPPRTKSLGSNEILTPNILTSGRQEGCS